MKTNQKHLLKLYLYLEYYKKDITDKYGLMITNIVLDNDILNNIKDKLYITTFDKYIKLQQENKQLKDNWNKLREWIVYNKHNENTEQHYLVVYYGTLLGKMKELEQGSDSE